MIHRFLGAAAALAVSAGMAQAEYTLHVLHINDLHSRIEPISRFDGTCGAEDDAEGKCFGGVARLKTLIDSKRSELAGENVVTLDAGDQFQGSLMYTTYKGDVEAEMMEACAIWAARSASSASRPGQSAKKSPPITASRTPAFRDR